MGNYLVDFWCTAFAEFVKQEFAFDGIYTACLYATTVELPSGSVFLDVLCYPTLYF